MSHRDDETMSEIMNGFMSRFDDTAFRAEWTHDGHVSEESVYAWLDGAIDSADNDAVQAHVSGCASCAEAVAEARGYIAASARIMHAADITPRRIVSNEDAARSAAHIIAIADRKESTSTTRASARENRPWYTHNITRVAAALLVAVGAYAVLRDEPQLRPTSSPIVAKEVPRNDTLPANSLPGHPAAQIAEKPDSVKQTASLKPARRNPMRAAPEMPGALQGRVAAASPPVSKPLPSVNVQAPAPAETQRALGFTVAQMSAAELSQGRTMSGVVRDENGQPVEQAFVRVAGVEGQVLTAADGSFTLNDVKLTASVIQVRRIGYESVDVRLDTMRTALLDVQLTRALMVLDGVAITGISGKVAGVQPVRCTEERHTLAGFVNSATAGLYTPLVTAIRIREPYSRKNDAVLEGWPDIRSTTKLKLVEDNEGSLSGSVQRSGVRLELQLSRAENGWIGIVREYRGANIRSENLQYRSESIKKCN